MARPLLAAVLFLLLGARAEAGPETALREFASAQIKKGVRVLGLGGDGATWGNYSLVWRDAGAGVADYGLTHFSDTGNDIHFVALGATSPLFGKKAAVYLVVLEEWAAGLRLHLKSPAFPGGNDFVAAGSDQAVFAKIALPLGRGVSFGLLVGWERSTLTAVDPASGATLSYDTTYLPSVGAGLTWEANRWLLVGVRALTNNDLEDRRDRLGTTRGYLGSIEVRAGVSVRVWRGALIDAGYVGLWRRNDVDHTERFEHALVAGFEQQLWIDHLAVRVGWNETSPTAGLSLRVWRLKLDVAYVHDLGVARTGAIFGHQDHAVIAALNFDYLPSPRR